MRIKVKKLKKLLKLKKKLNTAPLEEIVLKTKNDEFCLAPSVIEDWKKCGYSNATLFELWLAGKLDINEKKEGTK